MKPFILLSLVLHIGFSGSAQEHLAPPSGEMGLPGPILNSFVIQWAEVPDAVAYEYVLTNNSMCFAGCAGDTREERVAATTAIEYDLIQNIQYYWITRVFFANGDSSGWSQISNFQAATPPANFGIAMENPTPAASLVRVDWAALEGVAEVKMDLFDAHGRITGQSFVFRQLNSFTRFGEYALLLDGVRAGVYYARFSLIRRDGGEEARVRKLVVTEG